MTMNCKFTGKCTYYEDATQIGGTLKQNIEKFCNNNGIDCAFYLLLDRLGTDFLLPLNITQSDIESAKQVVKNEKPCWIFQKCPEDRRDMCPAFTRKKGKVCWAEKATLCQGKLQGSYMDKLNDVCKECGFFKHRKKVG